MTELSPIDQTFTEAGEDCVTIIAATAREVMQAALARGLGEQGYIIAGRVVPHRFALVQETQSGALFDDAPMVAATWVRRAAH